MPNHVLGPALEAWQVKSAAVGGIQYCETNMLNLTTLQQAVDAKLRVLKYLPHEGDLSVIVLKGHLLVEELLFILVQSAVKYPEAIKSAHLGYYKLALIAKALFYEDRIRPVWDAIFELNAIRNTLAHNLDPPDLEEKLRRFGHVCSGGHPEAETMLLADPQNVMANTIECMCGGLMGLLVSRSSDGDD